MPPVFTVGWVCALPVELAAAEVIMDEQYDPPPSPPNDTNIYTFGRVGVHNVVAACLPAGQMGTNSAADVASQMRRSFSSLRFGMLIGIGGGVPSDEHDIRLGDVVISQPAAQYGGVVQFDFGKTGSDGRITRTGSLAAPPTILLTALAKLRSNILLGKVHAMEHLSAFSRLAAFACPGPNQDVLYSASSQHVPGSTCVSCREEDIIFRQPRTALDPSLFFGTIASGNQVMKDAPTRDRISQDLGGVLCFEMEAAGLMNNFGCLVVRGICDYADAHKNKQWQPYAAAAAAAYAKELLLIVPQVASTNGDSQIDRPAPRVYSTISSLSNEEKDCLRSLAFPEQESRGQDIQFAPNTCQWLLEDCRYRKWTKKARGLFWVKGNPGTGKSALMKFAVTTMRGERPEHLVLSYFIHGRGTDLQKSLLGVFRALLNTMLVYFPQNLSQLTKIFEDREARYGSYEAMRWSWAVAELQDCMFKTLSIGTQDKPIIIFIDALDESGENDAKVLLEYLKELMQQIETEKGKVKICFSSRHYPILGLNTIPTVFVEEQNGIDIQLVVHERLKQILSGKRRRQIEEQILSKSQGGFQWAVLVTDKILDGNLTGVKEANLEKMLTSIPETLYGLYGDILCRSNGAKKSQMVKLFQWILFARRPLSSQELREALATNKDITSTNVDELRRHDSWVESLSQFETHVKHLSSGLVEFQDRDVWEQYEPDGELWNREAQFIHQSVADYLMEKFLPRDEEDRKTARSVAGAGHLEISRSCFRYITMGDVQGGVHLPRGSLSVRFPLAPYAVQSLFYHIRKVELEGLPQLDLLSLIQWDRRPKSLQQIAHLWKVLDPDHGHAPEGWPFIKATALHVLVAFGSESALDAALQEENPDIDVMDLDGNTPLLLAIRECYPEIALMLLDRSFEWSHRQIMTLHESTDQNQNNQQGRFDVDVNAMNDDGDTPLSVALTTTNAGKLILRLIKAGADVEHPNMKAQLFVYAIRNTDRALFMDLLTDYGPLDGSIYFLSQELLHKDKDDTLEVFLSELLKAGANTSRSRAFDGFSNTNNTRGHYNDDSVSGDDDHDDNEDGDENEEAILLASRKGATEAVVLLLSHDISPNCSNSIGVTPLLAALNLGYTHIVELLLAKGASPDLADQNGQTPLLTATEMGSLNMIELLLEKGANPDLADQNGQTPLLTAFEVGTIEFEVFEVLLAKGASPNLANKQGTTPLFAAVASQHLQIIGLLLDKGAEPNITGSMGMTPLLEAVDIGDLKIIELLLARGADPDTAGDAGELPLLRAFDGRNPDVIPALLARGANPDISNSYGTTPLLAAIASHGSGIIELLLTRGANPDIADNHGKTPLLSAVAIGDLEMIDSLLSGRANVDIADNSGKTPLSSALSYKRFEIAERLLANGARRDISDKNGVTPLIAASVNGDWKAVKLLLANGACRDSVTRDGRTALDLALANRHPRVASLLIDGTDLDIADDKRRPLHDLVLEKFTNLNTLRGSGRTPLDLAIAGGHFEAARLLLEKCGVNPNVTSKNGCRPLSTASARGHSELVDLLVRNSAYLDTLDEHGRTPLYAALEGGHFEIARLLLEKDANPNIANNQGRTPLHLASSCENTALLELLLEKSAKRGNGLTHS